MTEKKPSQKKDPPEPEKVLTIFQAMTSIVKDLGPIAKSKRNEEQNYQFRGIDAAMDALNPLLAKYGVFPTILEIEPRVFEAVTSRSGAKGFHLINKYTFAFYAQDGTHVTTKMEGEAIDYGDKAVTKAQSVAYREALYKTFCAPFTASLDIEDDSHSLKPEDETKKDPPKVQNPPAAAKTTAPPAKPANQTPAAPKAPERLATEYGIKKNREAWENYWVIKMGVKGHERNPDGTHKWTMENMWSCFEDMLEGLFGTPDVKKLTIKQSIKLEDILREKLNSIIAEETAMRVKGSTGDSAGHQKVTQPKTAARVATAP